MDPKHHSANAQKNHHPSTKLTAATSKFMEPALPTESARMQAQQTLGAHATSMQLTAPTSPHGPCMAQDHAAHAESANAVTCPVTCESPYLPGQQDEDLGHALQGLCLQLAQRTLVLAGACHLAGAPCAQSCTATEALAAAAHAMQVSWLLRVITTIWLKVRLNKSIMR